MKWLMPRLGEFQNEFPELDITLVSSPKLADIRNNEFDLGIRHCAQAPEGLRADLISLSPVYPYGALSLPDIANPEDLLSLPLLHEDKGQLWSRWFTNAGLTDFSLPRAPKPFASLLAIEGALAGQGVVLASAELVANDVSNGRLRRLSDIGLAFGGYHLVYLPETLRRKPVAAFRNWFMTATEEFRRSQTSNRAGPA